MIIKTKYLSDGKKIKNSAEIKEIMVNENLTEPEKQVTAIAFKNDSTSGLIEFNEEEIKKLVQSLKAEKKVVKKVKILRG